MVGVLVGEGWRAANYAPPPLATALSANAAITPPPSPLVAVMSGDLVTYDEVGSCPKAYYSVYCGR